MDAKELVDGKDGLVRIVLAGDIAFLMFANGLVKASDVVAMTVTDSGEKVHVITTSGGAYWFDLFLENAEA